MSKFLHGPPKCSRGPSVVRGPSIGDRCFRLLSIDFNHLSMSDLVVFNELPVESEFVIKVIRLFFLKRRWKSFFLTT
jgi:hypothetical protein